MTNERETYFDDDIRHVLEDTHTIAMIGASQNPTRASNGVMRFLQQAGYRVIPVNPGIADSKLHGEIVYAALEDIPEQIDMVNVFRRTDAIPDVVDDVVPLVPAKAIRYLWLQLDIYDEKSARRARAAGLQVVMDRCLKIEYDRLLS